MTRALAEWRWLESARMLEGMTKSMAVELAPDKIRVNALCPVAGETGMLADFMGGCHGLGGCQGLIAISSLTSSAWRWHSVFANTR